MLYIIGNITIGNETKNLETKPSFEITKLTTSLRRAIDAFVGSNDIIYKNLKQLYEEDIHTFAGSTSSRTRSIYDSLIFTTSKNTIISFYYGVETESLLDNTLIVDDIVKLNEAATFEVERNEDNNENTDYDKSLINSNTKFYKLIKKDESINKAVIRPLIDIHNKCIITNPTSQATIPLNWLIRAECL